jgi:hypothetical protein
MNITLIIFSKIDIKNNYNKKLYWKSHIKYMNNT